MLECWPIEMDLSKRGGERKPKAEGIRQRAWTDQPVRTHPPTRAGLSILLSHGTLQLNHQVIFQAIPQDSIVNWKED